MKAANDNSTSGRAGVQERWRALCGQQSQMREEPKSSGVQVTPSRPARHCGAGEHGVWKAAESAGRSRERVSIPGCRAAVPAAERGGREQGDMPNALFNFLSNQKQGSSNFPCCK